MEKILIGGVIVYVVAFVAFGRWAFPRSKWSAVLLLACLLPAPARAQGITGFGPRLTPAEAAAVLANCAGCLANVANQPAPAPAGPRVFVVGSRPGALSWLDFPPERPARRLDGTLLSDPPTVYGQPWWPITPFGFGVPILTTPPRANHERKGRK